MKSGVPRERLLSGRKLERSPRRIPLSGTVARRAKCDMLEAQ